LATFLFRARSHPLFELPAVRGTSTVPVESSFAARSIFFSSLFAFQKMDPSTQRALEFLLSSENPSGRSACSWSREEVREGRFALFPPELGMSTGSIRGHRPCAPFPSASFRRGNRRKKSLKSHLPNRGTFPDDFLPLLEKANSLAPPTCNFAHGRRLHPSLRTAPSEASCTRPSHSFLQTLPVLFAKRPSGRADPSLLLGGHPAPLQFSAFFPFCVLSDCPLRVICQPPPLARAFWPFCLQRRGFRAF